MSSQQDHNRSVSRTLGDLPCCDFQFDAHATTALLKDKFDQSPELPGAIVVDGGRILEAVSRDSLFRHLSRPFFREIFLKRPIREFVAMWCEPTLRLPSTCSINRAVELALSRPHTQTFAPLLVDFGARVALLDTQVLLVAQAELLALSKLVEDERDKAEAANRSKSEFLANISHELRTPLHGILSYAQFGLEEVESADRTELREFFQKVGHSAENLLHLVNDLLDLSKLESGRMSYEFEHADLRGLVAAVIDEFQSRCSKQRLRICCDCPDESVVTRCDPGRVQQVIRNVLGNAVKFSPSDGTVHVRVRRVGASILLSVRDEGPGIPADELEAVFDKFVQSSKTKSNSGGTGLGLAICREIVAAHGGRIWVENSDTTGCIFYCELPIASFEDSQDDAGDHILAATAAVTRGARGIGADR